MTTINLNDTVRVRLTDHGRARLSEYVDGLGFESALFDEKLTDAVTDWQLWELAHVFGRWMYNGAVPMFETTLLEHVPSEIDKQIEDATTVEVRILVRVDTRGHYHAAGIGEPDHDESETKRMVGELAGGDASWSDDDRMSWVIARVPKPEPAAEVEGTVEP